MENGKGAVQEPLVETIELTEDTEVIRKLASGVFWLNHKGKKFGFSGIGCPKVVDLLATFYLEKTMREEWWDVKEGDVVLDIGAGFGSYTLSALVSGAQLVIAAEPGRDEFFGLGVNLLVNGWVSQVAMMNCLFGDRVALNIDYYPRTHSVLKKRGRREGRLMTSIDNLVESGGLPRLDWIKIDVEGAEIGVVAGGLRTFAALSPKILIENHVGFVPGIDERIREMMVPLGYVEQQRIDPDKRFKNNNRSLWSKS